MAKISQCLAIANIAISIRIKKLLLRAPAALRDILPVLRLGLYGFPFTLSNAQTLTKVDRSPILTRQRWKAMSIIIDGHNLIGQMLEVSLADPDDEEWLIRRLGEYRHRTGRAITVVFDSGSSPPGYNPLSRSGIRVVYAPFRSSADAVIIRMIRREPNPKGLIVVSSDKEIAKVARERKAKVISSQHFAAELAKPKAPSQKREKGRLSPREIDEWMRIFGRG